MAEAPEQRAAIVTGAAGGIGVATVARLVGRGLRVTMVDANGDTLRAAASAFPAETVITHVADVTSEPAIGAAVAQAKRAFGRIDALVNIAGGAGPKRVADIVDLDLETWDDVLRLNVTSAVMFCKAVVPTMRAQRFGRIVNLSSILAHGEKGPPTTVSARLPYATAKAALLGLTAQLGKDLAADGITVNALLPGLILGDPGTRIRDRFDALPAADQARMLQGYPTGRAGTGDEVAAAIEFLVSDAAGYITGVALPIDGAYL